MPRVLFSDLAIFCTIPASNSLSFLTHSCSCVQTGRFLTLVLEPEAWFVLRMITVEINGRLVRCGEEGRRDILAAESANHRAGIQGPVTDLEEIMVSLGGEVKEL